MVSPKYQNINEHMKDEGLIKDRTELIFRELQGVLTIAYLSVILIGMIDSYVYYQQFEINIFDYSEVFDFFVAPFRKTVTLVYLGIALLSAYLGYSLDLFLEKRFPKFHKSINFGFTDKSWFKTYRFVSFIGVIIILLIAASQETGQKMRDKLLEIKGYDTEIVFDSEKKKAVKGLKIGMTSSYFFLLDSTKAVQIIPINNQVEKILVARNVEK
jgi:hypothetical protein